MTESVISKSQVEKYLIELGADEHGITEAAEAYENARARVEMGLRRYVALRDFVAEQLGKSPYAPGVEWPDVGFDFQRGRFRFTSMKISDAIMQVLEEAAEWQGKYPAWMTLEKIMERLSEGGLGFPEPVQARAINAAIQALYKTGVLQTNRLRATKAAVYAWVRPPETDAGAETEGKGDINPEDLPFE